MKGMCKAVGCRDRVWRARYRFCGFHWDILPQDMKHRVKTKCATASREAIYILSAARFTILLRERRDLTYAQQVALAYPKRYHSRTPKPG